LTEFTLSLPFLMLILLGILDLGRITASYVVLMNAAREGARYAASHPTNTTGIVQRARAEAAGTLVDPAQMNVQPPVCNPSPCDAGGSIQVQVTYPFRFITTFIFAGMSTLNISTQATFPVLSD
jgi:Flp pilus assembly protein TadG